MSYSSEVVNEEDLVLGELISTINYVFSHNYISHDPTFAAQMDKNDFSVPISVVLELPIVNSITFDLERVKKAAAASEYVDFNEQTQTMKPTFKLVPRTTLILRDIPPETKPEVHLSRNEKNNYYLFKI